MRPDTAASAPWGPWGSPPGLSPLPSLAIQQIPPTSFADVIHYDGSVSLTGTWSSDQRWPN